LTRDNILFILIGILAGFIAGYLMHDVMAERQPARLVHGDATAAPAGAPGATGGQAPQANAQARAQQIQELQKFVQANPDNTDAVLRLANLAYDAQAWPICVSSYEHYLTLADEQPDVLSDLGVCYREVGNPQKALETFDRAQELQPDHWQSRFNEVVILAFDLGEFDRAEKVLGELENLQPDNPDVKRLAAEVERRKTAAS